MFESKTGPDTQNGFLVEDGSLDYFEPLRVDYQVVFAVLHDSGPGQVRNGVLVRGPPAVNFASLVLGCVQGELGQSILCEDQQKLLIQKCVVIEHKIVY